MKCVKERAVSEGFLLVPIEAELTGIHLEEGKVDLLLPNPPPGWEERISLSCPVRRKFLAAMNQALEENGRKPVSVTLLIWPSSDEEGKWTPPNQDTCWALCFERNASLPPPKQLKVRLTGELLGFSEEKGLAKLKLSNGEVIVVKTEGSIPKEPGSPKIILLELDTKALHEKGELRGEIRIARGKIRLEHLRIRSLFDQLDPAIKLDGEEGFAINYGDTVLLYGEAKVGKTRAALALFADGKPKGKAGVKVDCRISVVGDPSIYYLSHVTETALPLLRQYAINHGWSEDRAEEQLYPFHTPRDVKEFLMDIPARSIVVVDSLVKLIPPGKSENDALHVEEALSPIISAAREKEHTLIVIHHARKSQHTFRGSTVIEALPDHVLQAHRPKGKAGRLLIEYKKGRSVPPRIPLLEITDLHAGTGTAELPREGAEVIPPRRPGAPPKYVRIVIQAIREIAKELGDEGNRVEEDILIKVLKKKYLPNMSKKEIKRTLHRYAGEGKKALNKPVLKMEKGEDGKIYYAASPEAARFLSSELSSESKSADRKSSRRARVRAT